MHPRSVLQAVLELWDELPALLGPHWADLYPQLERLLARLAQAPDDAQRASIAAELALLFRPHPAARERLRAVMQKLDQARRGGAAKGPSSRPPARTLPWPDLLSGLRQRLHPPVVTRYTDVTAPSALPLGQRGTVTVGLTRRPVADSVQAQPLALETGDLEVVLHAQSGGIEVLGETVRVLSVQPEADTPPVVFYVKGRSLGSQSLVLDFYQAGALVGSLHLVLDIISETGLESSAQSMEALLTTGGPYAPPPDLDLRVTVDTQAGQTRLHYVLHSPNGLAPFHYQPVAGRSITGTPKAYQARLIQKLEALAAGQDVDGQPLTPGEIEDKLQATGRLLYHELFSPELQSAYRRFRGHVRTLQITSDEPWIPWELVKPYDHSDPGDIIDDDFLCVQFQLTRWLAGRGAGAGRIDVQQIACVEAGQALSDAPLAYAGAEREYLAGLAAAYPGITDRSPDPATAAAVETLLDAGGIHLYHFAAHGNVSLAQPDESVLYLAGGRGLRAEDLHGARQTHVSRDRPLVFLNACRVGQQGWSLTRLGGWAAAWVDRARCGAFIGPLWAVDDWLAYEFARTFYDHLRQGHTLAHATRSARLHLRDLAPDAPTWLAYSLYAHPNTRVTFA